MQQILNSLCFNHSHAPFMQLTYHWKKLLPSMKFCTKNSTVKVSVIHLRNISSIRYFHVFYNSPWLHLWMTPEVTYHDVQDLIHAFSHWPFWGRKATHIKSINCYIELNHQAGLNNYTQWMTVFGWRNPLEFGAFCFHLHNHMNSQGNWLIRTCYCCYFCLQI